MFTCATALSRARSQKHSITFSALRPPSQSVSYKTQTGCTFDVVPSTVRRWAFEALRGSTPSPGTRGGRGLGDPVNDDDADDADDAGVDEVKCKCL
ncbi:hypothetical protein CVT25_000885 [Psilocybe cyanescens]|uniref:Uncharacterized protein n=1 Tax=Psilocybe cyanescens TaxID=93625 RepID=A0A409XEU1_PSICY|nr:hypothetical protein CVT25_000885 [Psilocybe cyanescens]